MRVNPLSTTSNATKIRGAMRNPQRLSSQCSRGRCRGSFRSDWAFCAVVTRFNYAKHGAANRVVLDTGNIVHSKREGMTSRNGHSVR